MYTKIAFPADFRSNNLFSSEATEDVHEMVRIASDHIWTTSAQVGCYGAPGRAVAWIRHWIRFPRYLRDLQRHRRHMSVPAQRRFLHTSTSTVEQLFYRAEKNYLRHRKNSSHSKRYNSKMLGKRTLILPQTLVNKFAYECVGLDKVIFVIRC